MVDIALNNTKGYWDFGISQIGDFELDNGLQTAILVSLLSNARADASEIPIIEFRDGWYGNLIWNQNGYQQGSKLWLLYQSRLTQEIILRAKNYTEIALNWMLEDGLLKNLVVNVIQNDSISFTINIKADTSENIKVNFDYQVRLIA